MMVLFDKRACFTYDVVQEGEDKVIRIDCDQCTFAPSVEDSALCMAKVIEILAEVNGITKIVLIQKRDYEYDYYQTQILSDIAQLYRRLSREERVTNSHLVGSSGCERYLR